MKIVEISLKSAESTDESIVLELQVDAVKGDRIVLKKDWTTFSQFSGWMKEQSEQISKNNAEVIQQALRKQKDDWIEQEKNSLLTTFQNAIDEKDNEITRQSNLVQNAIINYQKSPEYTIMLASHQDTANEFAKLKQKMKELAAEESLKLLGEKKEAWLSEGKKQWQENWDASNKPWKELLAEKDAAIEVLNNDIAQLKGRNTGSSKTIGENFEIWCQQKLKSAFSLLQDKVVITKPSFPQNSPAGSDLNRADILVRFYFNHDKAQGPDKSITIECKTFDQSKDESSQKNNIFIKKLIQDAKSQKSSVAILVTELERNDTELSVFVDQDNSTKELEVIICRPEYLVPLIKLHYIGYKKLGEIEAMEGRDFCYKEEISKEFLEKFASFKKKLITVTEQIHNHFASLDKCLSTISVQTEKAQDIVHDKIQKKFNAILASFEKMTPKFGKDLDKIFDEILNAKEPADIKTNLLEAS